MTLAVLSQGKGRYSEVSEFENSRYLVRESEMCVKNET